MADDRTTIKAAVQELVSQLRDGLTASPPTAGKPFRAVRAGFDGPEAAARPFLAVRLSKATPSAALEGDKVFDCTAVLRLVTDIAAADAHDELLDKAAAVEDFFDGLLAAEASVVEGADGFDDRSWTYSYPSGTVGGGTAAAECTMTCRVRVERGANREPSGA